MGQAADPCQISGGAQVFVGTFALAESGAPSPGLRPRTAQITAWILNDDVVGTSFQALSKQGVRITRVVDGRLVQHAGASRRALVEGLRQDQPDLLCGLLKAPATHIGTALERRFFDTVSELFQTQTAAGRHVLFLGRSQNRLENQSCF